MKLAAALLLCAALARATDATDECASSLAIEDVERYKRDGYVIIRSLFSAAEADVLRAEQLLSHRVSGHLLRGTVKASFVPLKALVERVGDQRARPVRPRLVPRTLLWEASW